MNVAVLPSAFHPSLGGVEELTRQLALELQRQGHNVLVVTQRWPRDLPAAETVDGLSVRRFPMRAPDGCWKSNLSYFLTHRQIRRAIVDALRQFRPDVLHVQCVSSGTLYALHARQALGVPLVVTTQGELTMDADGLFGRPGIAQTLFRRAMTEADVVTGCSGKTLADAVAFLGRPIPRPTEVIFNGASGHDAAQATPHRRERPYVLALGRMVPQKGFDVLLDAVPQALPDGWELVLAGDGPNRGDVERRLAADAGLRSKVTYLGRADRTLVPQLMKGCAFVAIPSRADEGLPVVCAEAIAAGRPIVGTTMGGIPEAVTDGVNGLLVPPENAEALTTAIRTLAVDADKRAAMARAAAERATDFVWSSIAGRYLAAYRRAVAGASAGTAAVLRAGS